MFLPRCARSETLVRFYDLNSEKLRGTNEPFFLQHHFLPFFSSPSVDFLCRCHHRPRWKWKWFYDNSKCLLWHNNFSACVFLGRDFLVFTHQKKSNLNAARPRTQMLHDGLSQFINLITFLKHKSWELHHCSCLNVCHMQLPKLFIIA